jgi:hypothetical protein
MREKEITDEFSSDLDNWEAGTKNKVLKKHLKLFVWETTKGEKE